MSQSRARAARARSPKSSRPPLRVVRAAGPADLLRAVPDLLPVDPVDSLVVVLFRRSQGTTSRAHGGLRVDLRHTEDPEALGAWASDVLGTVLQVEGVTGVAVAAYTDEPFAPSGRPPAAAQVRAVAKRAGRLGLEVLDRLVVAPDGWGSLDDPDLPRGGHPLALIAPERPRPRRPDALASPAPAPEAARERFRAQHRAWWRHPAGPGGEQHGVALEPPAPAPRRGPSWMGPPPSRSPMDRYRFGLDLEDLVGLIEGALQPHDDAEEGPCACRALLASIAERQGLVAMLLAQIGWGEDFGREVWTAFADPEHRQRSARRMLEALGGRFRRPDPDRIDAAIGALVEVGAYVEQPRILAGVDEALAWLHWAAGAGSTAAGLARRSLARHPDRDLAPVVLDHANRGVLPGWAYRADPRRPDPFQALLEPPQRHAG